MLKKISHYEIIKELGSGGMGAVYLARDTSLDRFVALKILSPEVSSNSDRMRRFKIEAKAASALEHPNVVSIYEIGEENGIHFIAMQFAEGETLHKLIGGGLMKTPEILRIAIQLADALQEAHSKGIIHRDIKSSNILITPRLQAKLLDFGLAKISQPLPKSSDITTATKTELGVVLGTLPYMSPEQVQGKTLDHRTDIFSFGAVLYEMCTGSLPFSGTTAAEVISQILQTQPPAIARLNYNVPLELERIVRKCLEKDPGMRYQSAQDIMIDLKALDRDLHGLISGAPLPVRKTTTRRRWLIPATIALLLAACVTVFWLVTTQPQKIETTKPPGASPSGGNTTAPLWQNSIAVLPFKNVSSEEGQEYFCDGMTEEIIANLAQIRDLKVIARTTMLAYQRADKSVREIGRELGVKYVLEGSVRKASNRIRITAQLIQTEDESHVWSQDFDRELKDVFAVQDEVARVIASKLKLSLSDNSLLNLQRERPQNMEAYEYRLKASFTVNRRYLKSGRPEDFQKALEFGLKAVQADPNYADGYCTLVFIHEVHYQFTVDPGDVKQMAIYADKAYSLNPDLTQTNNAKAWVFVRSGQYELAYPYLKRSLELDPNFAPIYVYAGVFSAAQGLNDQAVSLASRSVECDPLNFWAYTVRGCNYAFLGETDKAIDDFDRVRQLGVESTGLSWCHAAALLMKKQYKEADEVLTRQEQHRSQDVRVREIRALYYAMLGNHEKALSTSRCAWVLAFLGKKSEALAGIEEEMVPSKAHDFFHWHGYLTLTRLPWFDPLRGDPRFEEIVQRQKIRYELYSKKYKLP